VTRPTLSPQERTWLLSGAGDTRSATARFLDRPVRLARRRRLADEAALLDALTGDAPVPGPHQAAVRAVRTKVAAGHTLAQAVAADPAVTPGTARLLAAYCAAVPPATAAGMVATRLRARAAELEHAWRRDVAPSRAGAGLAALALAVTVLVAPGVWALTVAGAGLIAAAAWGTAWVRTRAAARGTVHGDVADADLADVADVLHTCGVPWPVALRKAAAAATDRTTRQRWEQAAQAAAAGQVTPVPATPRPAPRWASWTARSAATLAWAVALLVCAAHP
jgi:hypothetical protein